LSAISALASLMRELSIIDLTSGVHPIGNEDKWIHILVNGEFYDFERQRHEFERCVPSLPDALGQ